MSELIIHAGAPKTGTSALQDFLFNNRKILLRQNAVYPDYEERGTQNAHKRNGSALFKWASGMARGVDLLKEDPVTEMAVKSLEENLKNHKRVVISYENFFHGENRFWRGESCLSKDIFWKSIACCCKRIGAEKVRVVVFLRRQDRFIMSWWRHSIKMGHTNTSLREFSIKMQPFLNYYELIKSIDTAFSGMCNIKVCVYDDSKYLSIGGEKMENDNVFKFFLKAADLLWDEEFQINDHRINTSITFDVAFAMRMFYHKALPYSLERRELIKIAKRESIKNPDVSQMTIFTPEQAMDFMSEWQASNQLLSERYCECRELFDHDFDKPLWIANWNRIYEYCRMFESKLAEIESK